MNNFNCLKLSFFYTAFACLVVLIIAPGFLHQSNYLDPNVYAGYIHNYASLYSKYGQTYYSTRIAYLLPEMFSTWILGNYLGYFSVRLLLITGIAFSLHQLFSTYYLNSTGYVAGIFFLCISWFLSSLKWTHYDGFAAGYLFLSMIFFYLGLRKMSPLWWFLSGAFSYLATNCNLLMLPISGIFYISVLVSELFLSKDVYIKRLRPYFIGLLGYFTSFLILSIMYVVIFKPTNWFLEKAAFDIAISQQKGGATTWFVGFHQMWTDKHFFAFVPFIPLVMLLFRANTEKATKLDHYQTLIILSSKINYLALLGFALFEHFYVQAGWFGYQYYVIYFLPGMYILLLSIVGVNFKQIRPFEICLMVGCLLSVIFFTITPNTFQDFLLLKCLFTIVFLLAVVSSILNRPRYYLSACMLILVLSQAVLSTDKFYKFPKNESFEWGVFQAGIKLQNFIDNHLPHKTSLLFFYSSKRNGNLDPTFDAIQSRFLWGYSRLQDGGEVNFKLPNNYRERLKPNTYIAILGMSNQELSEAKNALAQGGLKFITVDSSTYVNPGITYLVELIQIEG